MADVWVDEVTYLLHTVDYAGGMGPPHRATYKEAGHGEY